MSLFFRIILLLAIARFAFQALIGYAFDFRDHGYPLWPLLALGFSFAAYIQLRPSPNLGKAVAKAGSSPGPSSLGSNVDHAFLFLILAIVSSAFLLDKRGEDAITPVYFLHLSTLTLFLLLLPFIAASGFGKIRSLVTALSTLVLLFFLVDGTMRDPEPVIQYFTKAGAYESAINLPEPGLKPIPIIPPDPTIQSAIANPQTQIPPASIPPPPISSAQ